MAGPSSSAAMGELSGEAEAPDLQGFKLRAKQRPQAAGNTVSTVAYVAMFVCHNHFIYDKRNLVPDETTALINRKFFGSSARKWTPKLATFRSLEDSDEKPHPDFLTLFKDVIKAFEKVIEQWWLDLLQHDVEARRRAKFLHGLEGRIPAIEFAGPGLVLGLTALQDWQYLLEYGIVNLCRDRLANEPLEPWLITAILANYYDIDPTDNKAVLDHHTDVLRNKEHRITVGVAEVAGAYSDWLQNKADEMYDAVFETYAQEQGFNIDDVSGITQSMRSTSLTATASASASTQPFPRGLGPSAGGRVESEEEGSEEEAKPTGKGKGKAAAKRAHSDSPGTQGESYRAQGPPPPGGDRGGRGS